MLSFQEREKVIRRELKDTIKKNLELNPLESTKFKLSKSDSDTYNQALVQLEKMVNVSFFELFSGSFYNNENIYLSVKRNIREDSDLIIIFKNNLYSTEALNISDYCCLSVFLSLFKKIS